MPALNVSEFIAKKLAFGKQKNFTKFIIQLSCIATAVSVSVMIIALGVVNGFQNTITAKIFNFLGAIRVEQAYNEAVDNDETLAAQLSNVFPANDSLERQIKGLAHVKTVAPFATQSCLLKYKTGIESVILKGIDKSYPIANWESFLKQGRWPLFSKEGENFSKEIVLSVYTAKQLNALTGDSLIIYFIKEDGSKAARKLRVSGLFATGIERYDNNFAVADINLIRTLNKWQPTAITGYEVAVDNYKNIDTVSSVLNEKLPNNWYSDTIRSLNPDIFDWLNLQGQIKNILIIIMIVIAVINLTTCLIILALDRTQMIGVLKAIGANNFTIQKIFIYGGAIIATIGIVLGLIVGVGLSLLQKYTGFIKLNETAYYISRVEVDLVWWQVLLVCLVTLLVSFLCLIIPTYIIKKVNIIKAIRFN